MHTSPIRHASDPFSFTITSEDQDRIRNNALAATASGVIINHLPAGLSAYRLPLAG